MNCTKFIPPSPFFIDFYFHYSNFTLLLSLLITPLQFYIILTKSQNLKSFKWLILNHSVWSLLFEISLVFIKPVILAPSMAVYPIGIIRNGSFYITGITGYIFALIGVTFSSSLTMTLVNRYFFAFPSSFIHRLNKKFWTMLYALFVLIIYIVGTFVAKNNLLSIDPLPFYHAAIEYDPCMQIFVMNEPGYVFIPMTNFAHLTLVLASVMFIFGIIVAFFNAIYFLYLVKSQNSQTVEKLRRSLIISSIVQISIILSLLYIPLAICVIVLSFEILHMENIFIILFCIILSHSFFESLATLYFVTPYRKGIIEIFTKHFSYFINTFLSKTVVVSSVTTVTLNLRAEARHS